VSGSFFNSFVEHLQNTSSIEVDFSANNKGIIAIHEKKVLFHLLPTIENKFPPKIEFPSYRQIHIHEDLWFNQRAIMVSRINQVFGLNQKIAARTCVIKPIEKIDSEDFLKKHHLLGSCNAAYRIGLFYKNELVALGTFSKSRVMVDGKVYYRSFEMLRFAVKAGYSVTGGLGKILKYFIQTKNVVHLMTYIDNEWGVGEAFLQLGFMAVSTTENQTYWIDPTTFTRLKSMSMLSNNMALIEKSNLGSTKLVLDLRPNDN
jgi:hypothetical protein